jgi:hypothetical protein
VLPPTGIETAEPADMGVAARHQWLLPVLLAAALLPLAAAPVLPMIDFYNHIMRYVVLSQLPADPALAQHYAANWALLPNVGLDVIAVFLLRFVPQEWLPHLIVAAILFVQFFGVLAFNRAITSTSQWLPALLLLPLLYSWVLNWGFTNFLLGLGLVFAAAAHWLTWPHRPVRRMAVALPAAVLIYLVHGLAFALYGLLIAALETGKWLHQRRLHPGHRLPIAAVVRPLLACAVQAIVPAALFVTSRTVQYSQEELGDNSSVLHLWRNGALVERLTDLLAWRVQTIVRVAEGPGYGADILWLGALMLALGLLWRARLISLEPGARLAIVLGIGLVLLCPPALFGVGSVADRMPLFLALLLVGCLHQAPGLSWRHPAAIAVAGLVVVRLVSIGILWNGTGNDLADLDHVARRLPAGQIVGVVNAYGSRHDVIARRCDVYPHVMALRHRQIVPLFAYRSAQPLTLAGRLADADRQAATLTRSVDGSGSVLLGAPGQRVDLLAAAGFDYVLLCRAAADQPWPVVNRPLLAAAGRFRIYDTRGG